MLVHFDSYIKGAKKFRRPYNRNMICPIEKIVSEFQRTASLADFFKNINKNPQMQKTSSYMYEMQNYKFCIGSSDNMQDTIDNLSFVNQYRLQSAPKLHTHAHSKGNKYAMIVFDMPDTKLYSEDMKLPLESKMQYYTEMANFSRKTGLYNPSDSNPNGWLITDDGKIILSDWSELKEFTDTDTYKKHYNELADKLGLVYS